MHYRCTDIRVSQKCKVCDRHTSTWRPGSLTCGSNFCKIVLNLGYIYWSHKKCLCKLSFTLCLNGRFCFGNNHRLPVITSALQRPPATLRRLDIQSRRDDVKLTSWVTMVKVGHQKGGVKSHVTMSSSHIITLDLLARSRRSLHHSIQRMGFHQPF